MCWRSEASHLRLALAAVAACAALFACDQSSRTAPPSEAPASSSPGGGRVESDADTPDARAQGEAGARPEPDAGDPASAFVHARPLSGKSVGHTSVVFKLKLDGGVEAAFKPRSKRGGARYAGEVAAFRLSRHLGLPNVPPAYARVFEAGELRAALAAAGGPAASLFDAEVITEANGLVPGAILPWLPHFELLPLETAAWRARWRGWLGRGAAVPDGDRAMASQISSMIVFDYLTANWDRWSGGNVAIDRPSGTVLFIDNDGAFFEPPPGPQTAAQLALVREVFRFSRGFVSALRALDAPTLAAALGEETPGAPLLGAKAVAAILKRRATLVAIIDAKIKADGEQAVLAFD